MVFDLKDMLNDAISRVNNRLIYSPTVLKVLEEQFVLRDTINVYSQFKKVPSVRINLSDFSKFKEKCLLK